MANESINLGGGGSAKGALRFDKAQELTEEQKSQGRENLDAQKELTNTDTIFKLNGGDVHFGDNVIPTTDTVVIDSAMSDSSTNPVQNKVVKSAIDKKVEIAVGKNRFNPNDETIVRGKYLSSSGSMQTNDNYLITAFIPFSEEDGKLILDNGKTVFTGTAYACLYDGNKNFIAAVQENPAVVSWQQNVEYVRFSVQTSRNEQVEVGETPTEYKEYSPIGKYTEKTVGESDIQDNSITKNKLNTLLSDNLPVNNYRVLKSNVSAYNAVTLPHYIAKGSLIVNNSECNIAVAENSGLTHRLDIGIGETKIALYDYHHMRTLLGGGDVDVSVFAKQVNIEDGAITTSKIKDGAVTQEKLADGVHVNPAPAKFGCIYSGNQEIASGETINTPFIHGTKNTSIVVSIDSVFDEVTFGVGEDSFYQYAFILDGTNIKAVTGNQETQAWTEAHGLTLGSKTTIIVSKNITSANSKITIFNDEGESWSKVISFSGQGRPFLKNSSESTITACISYNMRDINEKIWLFGDSYFSYESNERWPYYPIQDGYTSFLLSSQGGDVSGAALQSFQTLIATGARPSYAVWCMGMNGSADSGTTPNATWLADTQSFLDLCETNGIIPILSTTPTVPERNHAGRNAWVRNQEYRYIDFASAVEVEGSTYWKNWGETNAMLEDAMVHPTSYGAKALWQQVLRDFPEITVL